LKLPSTFIVYMGSSDPANWADRYTHFYSATTKKSVMTNWVRTKPENDGDRLKGEKQKSTNLNSIENLTERIQRGPDARANFVASHIDKGIAYQIKSLRDQQELSQEDLAAKVGMNQNAISRLESPERGRPTITTLKRLAAAFDVALVVRFVPFSKLVKWVSGTPFVEEGLSTDSLAVPSFDEEMSAKAFEIPVATITPEFISQVPDRGMENYVNTISLNTDAKLDLWSVGVSETQLIGPYLDYNFKVEKSLDMAPLELIARQSQETRSNA
jgi:transcriptional regulator with XRE-family HTH domain